MKKFTAGILLSTLTATSAYAGTWGDIGTTGTLTANDLCYTDGTDIICDTDLSVNGTHALEVSGTVSASGNGTIGHNSANINNAAILIEDSTAYQLAFDPNEIAQFGGVLNIQGEGGIRFHTGDTADGNLVNTAMAVTNTGDVAIGKATPTSELDVSGTVTADYFVGDGSGLTNIAAGALTVAIDDLTDGIYDGSSLFLGNNAGVNDDATTNYNTGVGKDALTANTSGTSNVALGYVALNSNTIGSYNAGLGAGALTNNTEGDANIGIGINALNSNTTADRNIGLGGNTLRTNTTGQQNVAIGSDAGYGAPSPNEVHDNIFIGYRAGFGVDTGADNNIMIGQNAGDGTTTGARNILIGTLVDATAATASDELNIGNTIYGDLANGFVGIGTDTPTVPLEVIGETQTDRLVVNAGAGSVSLKPGSNDHVYMQFFADTAAPTTRSGFLGYASSGTNGLTLFNEMPGGNVFLMTEGNDGYVGVNTYTPTSELDVSGTVTANAFIGDGSGLTNISAGSLTVGINDLTDGKHDTDDYSSLFLGNGAGANDDGTNNFNTGVGKNALSANTSGISNSAFGNSALEANISGFANTAFGYSALRQNTAGNHNTAIGYQAGDATTGSDNTMLGYRAGDATTSGGRNILIGAYVDASAPTASNELNIGDTIKADLTTGNTDVSGTLQVAGTATEACGAAGDLGKMRWNPSTQKFQICRQ